jgi:hypothetical protein
MSWRGIGPSRQIGPARLAFPRPKVKQTNPAKGVAGGIFHDSVEAIVLIRMDTAPKT